MNYEQFRAIWHQALDEAGLLSFPPRPSESVDLGRMSRTYRISVTPGREQRAKPFHVAAELSWRWDALQSARTETTEEDLLMELLGRDGYYLVTERPWLRVNVTLRAMLPLYAPMPMPDTEAWRRWGTEVAACLDPFLPIEAVETEETEQEEELEWPLAWRGEPIANVHCDAEGQLYLTAVELPAWQGIELARQWDNPDREWDLGPAGQLVDFSGRLHQALKAWEDCLGYLRL